ncbi:hydrolase [Shewanella atlantica]|uniref:hydrolase n=1 Tax=Shewanella atlantica TaxID=271099 RepID=UPI003734DBB4
MLKPEECVLVVVDIQGGLAGIMEQSEALHQTVLKLIQGLRLFEIPTLWLEQLPQKLGKTSPMLSEELIKTCSPISKQHFSGWNCHDFREQLQQSKRKQIILVGIEAHICVYQTCLDLVKNGFEPHIVVDAVSSRTAENKRIGIKMMQERGAHITNMESLLFELQHEASGERFKQLLRLIK